MGANEKDGSNLPFGKGNGTAVVTSGIGLTTCKIKQNTDIVKTEKEKRKISSTDRTTFIDYRGVVV